MIIEQTAAEQRSSRRLKEPDRAVCFVFIESRARWRRRTRPGCQLRSRGRRRSRRRCCCWTWRQTSCRCSCCCRASCGRRRRSRRCAGYERVSARNIRARRGHPRFAEILSEKARRPLHTANPIERKACGGCSVDHVKPLVRFVLIQAHFEVVCRV